MLSLINKLAMIRFLKTFLSTISLLIMILFTTQCESSDKPGSSKRYNYSYVDDEGLAIQWELLEGMDLQTGKTAKEVSDLNGKYLRIPGYMIPLEDYLQEVTEFLLVPSALACVHEPPPAPNQIIHVQMEKPVKMRYQAPTWVYGTLTIDATHTGPIYATFIMKSDKLTAFKGWGEEIQANKTK